MRTTATGDPTAPTVVFLHGLGVTSWMWDEQVERLSDRFHCVTVDLPGQGRNHDRPWESLEACADAIAEQVRPAHVVGLSLGGYVALALLVRHPDLVRSAVVSGVTPTPLLPPWLRGVAARAITPVLRSRLVARGMGRAMGLTAEERAVYAADARRLAPATVRAVYRDVLDHRLPAGTDAVGERLLAVAGDGDVRSIRDGLADLAAAGATTAVVPRAGHAWVAQHPDLFARMTADWITDRSLTPELALSRV
jgi:pimeloyl-ACP methyl ester carboxylesterase